MQIDPDLLQQLVDQLIDAGLVRSVATDWSLTLPKEWVELLPLQGDRLERPFDDGRSGYYRAAVYRGLELVAMPLTKPVMILSDATGLVPSLYMNARTGQIGQKLAEAGLTDPVATTTPRANFSPPSDER